MSNALVSVSDIRKSYADVEVLCGVSLDFEAQKIHAFLGANGAGKSTFLGCLSGAVEPSSGHIHIEGRTFNCLQPRQALNLGIGIIYQHFQVFEGLTVAENIFLGHELRAFGCIDKSKQIKEAERVLARLKVPIDPRSPLETLSTGERKIVEIARALILNPRLLILDEPTAALGKDEMAVLHDVVRQVAHQEGIGVVYVTHLLDEIDAIADTVTVLRNGSVVWTRPKEKTNTREMAEAIAPSSITKSIFTSTAKLSTQPLFQLEDYQSPFTGPVNLNLHSGEAIGVYGLLGAGRTDLLEAISGARPKKGGRIRIKGKAVDITSPSVAFEHGISLVASDRTEQSLFGNLSATENLLMPHFGGALLPKWLRNSKLEEKLFMRIAERLAVHPANPRLAAGQFSGGNAQKIVLGRWLLNEQEEQQIILLDEPTQGVDIGARFQLYESLRAVMAQGAGLIFASSDPTEIITLADRVLILGYGKQIELIDNPKNERKLVEIAHRTESSIHSHRSG
ncbi:sugar ABC transporter ATP-binding protein [Vibrio sp. S9_S30]|uniref:sugar ABC transporter ATP-binding protein n=1 Tax=Vibrio sp. S9_S30 TaxID=2720226 RepID=UPI001681284F|nr:sugar ABC transporter ATP-binding protein [Vibrio sp. S9_S30]MBD1558161.1 sugar ABC transporter ATP-binding protein [Vibrio sp. S9_S30]